MAWFTFLIWFPNSSSYEEDFENSEGDENDDEEDEEDATAAADAEPAPVPAGEEPTAGIYISLPVFIPPNSARVKWKRKEKMKGSHKWVNAPEIASRPSKKRKLAPQDVQEISDEDGADAAAGADGAEEDEDEDVEDGEEQFYESENGEEEAVDLLPAGKRSVANKSNAKASIKSAELVENDDDDNDEWIRSLDVVPIFSWMGNDTRYIFFLQPVKQYPSHSETGSSPPPSVLFPPWFLLGWQREYIEGPSLFLFFYYLLEKMGEGAGGGRFVNHL